MNFAFMYSLLIGLFLKSVLRDCVFVSFCMIMLSNKQSPKLSDLKLETFVSYSQIWRSATIQVGLDLGLSFSSCSILRDSF